MKYIFILFYLTLLLHAGCSKTTENADQEFEASNNNTCNILSNEWGGKNTQFQLNYFEDIGRKSAYDESCNLEWQRCEVGKRFVDDECVGKAAQMTWREALQHVNELNAKTIKENDRDITIWRLPSVSELLTLYNCENDAWNPKYGKYQQTRCIKSVWDDNPNTDDENNINSIVFPNSSGANWSIDQNMIDMNGSGGWNIIFRKSIDDELNSHFIFEYRSHKSAVRLVRAPTMQEL